MRKLSTNDAVKVVAGDFEARLAKQTAKCRGGSIRACRRATRMAIRMIK